MKIVHFDLKARLRGGQIQAYTLHRGLLERGVDSHFIVRRDGMLHARAEREQVPNMHPVRIGGRIRGFVGSLLLYPAIRKILRRLEPDLLHFHEPDSVIFGALFPRYFSCETRRVSTSLRDRSIRFKYRNIDAHIGVSDHVSDLLREKHLQNVHTVPSCIDLQRFQNIQPVDLRNPARTNFLYVGSMSKMKGIDILLNAFALTCKRHPGVRLHLVGGGSLLDSYIAMAKSLGIGDRTEFYGFASNVEQYYPAADLVIVPSIYGEGSNGVIKEALAAGKVVIASDFLPNREIIEHGVNGILFENANATDLDRKLEAWLNNELVIDIDAARRSVERFSSERMVDAYYRLYQSFLGSGRAKRADSRASS